METYIWDNNKSKQTATEILNWKSDQKLEPPREYGYTVETLFNEGENQYNIDKYKEQVVKMLRIAWRKPPPPPPKPSSVPPNTIESKVKKKQKPATPAAVPATKPLTKPVEPHVPLKIRREKTPIPSTPRVKTVEEKQKSTVEVADTKRTFWFHP